MRTCKNVSVLDIWQKANKQEYLFVSWDIAGTLERENICYFKSYTLGFRGHQKILTKHTNK